MKVFFWYLAKSLQASALVVVAYALYVGLNTQDPTSELQWLVSGAAVFLVGIALERFTGAQS